MWIYTICISLLLFINCHSKCASTFTVYGDYQIRIYESQSSSIWNKIAELDTNEEPLSVSDIETTVDTKIRFDVTNLAGSGDFIATIKIFGPTGQSEEIYTDKYFTYIKPNEHTLNLIRTSTNSMEIKSRDRYGEYVNDPSHYNDPQINANAYWTTWYDFSMVTMQWFLDFASAKNIINKICQNQWKSEYENGLFIIPNNKSNFADAKIDCENKYNGNIVNIYEPNENRIIHKLVNENYLEKAFIGYYKIISSEWQWDSGAAINPNLWLETPLADVTANIETPDTKCMVMSRFGWQYTSCDTEHFYVCEVSDHIPIFNESYPFMLSNRKLGFNDGRSLCRAQFGADLATIYEEEEYKHIQSVCNGVSNDSCWIGYRKGILNDNEWD
eukprot:149853_1